MLFVQRREGIEDALVLAGRDQSALDTELLHRAGEAEAVHQHADRADDRGLVDEDLVRRDSDVVGSRGAGLVDDDVELLVVLGLQAAQLVVDDAGLHRAAARRVDAQHHRTGALVLEGALQAGQQVLGAGVGVGCDLAAQFHQRRVRARRRGGGGPLRQQVPGDRDHQAQPRQAEEDLPAPVAAPVAQVRSGELVHHLLQRRTRTARLRQRTGLGGPEVVAAAPGRRCVVGQRGVLRIHRGPSCGSGGRVGADQPPTGRMSREGYQYTCPSRSSVAMAMRRPRPQGPPAQ